MTQLKRPQEVVFEFPQPPGPYPQSNRSGVFVGPSGVVKTPTALAMLMGPYKHCFSRVYVFSPSCVEGMDPAWDSWRKHVRIHMRVPDEEQTMWDTWRPDVLEQLIKRHQRVNAHLKAKKQKRGFCVCVICDDFADQGDRAMHSSTNILTSLFVRGRHLRVACWMLTQKLRIVSLICRTNVCWLMTWRLRKSKEHNTVLEELDALVGRKLLHEMYQIATSENTASGTSICLTREIRCFQETRTPLCSKCVA